MRQIQLTEIFQGAAGRTNLTYRNTQKPLQGQERLISPTDTFQGQARLILHEVCLHIKPATKLRVWQMLIIADFGFGRQMEGAVCDRSWF